MSVAYHPAAAAPQIHQEASEATPYARWLAAAEAERAAREAFNAVDRQYIADKIPCDSPEYLAAEDAYLAAVQVQEAARAAISTRQGADASDLQQLLTSFNSCQPDGKAALQDFVAAPIRTAAEAEVKLTFVRQGFTDGETGHEERVVDQVLAFLASPPETVDADCPVAALAPVLEHLASEEARLCDAGDEAASTAIGDQRDDLATRIVGLQATSAAGACVQLLLANERAELIRGCTAQEDRDHHHDQLDQLMRSALSVLGTSISDELWSHYVGGERRAALIARDRGDGTWAMPPTPGVGGMDDGALFLAMEAECLACIEAMKVDDEAQHDRWYNHAAALDELICRREGRGLTVALVKLRRLHCPIWGMVGANADSTNRDWPAAVQTAMSALTAAPATPAPLTPAELLQRLEDCEVVVTGRGFDFPSGCHGAAPWLLSSLTKEQGIAVLALASERVAA